MNCIFATDDAHMRSPASPLVSAMSSEERSTRTRRSVSLIESQDSAELLFELMNSAVVVPVGSSNNSIRETPSHSPLHSGLLTTFSGMSQGTTLHSGISQDSGILHKLSGTSQDTQSHSVLWQTCSGMSQNTGDDYRGRSPKKYRAAPSSLSSKRCYDRGDYFCCGGALSIDTRGNETDLESFYSELSDDSQYTEYYEVIKGYGNAHAPSEDKTFTSPKKWGKIDNNQASDDTRKVRWDTTVNEARTPTNTNTKKADLSPGKVPEDMADCRAPVTKSSVPKTAKATVIAAIPRHSALKPSSTNARIPANRITTKTVVSTTETITPTNVPASTRVPKKSPLLKHSGAPTTATKLKTPQTPISTSKASCKTETPTIRLGMGPLVSDCALVVDSSGTRRPPSRNPVRNTTVKNVQRQAKSLASNIEKMRRQRVRAVPTTNPSRPPL